MLLEFEKNRLLIDFLEIDDLKNSYFSVSDLSTSSLNALRRAMLRNEYWEFSTPSAIKEKYSKPIATIEIAKLKVSDILDLNQVGETKIKLLLDDLKRSTIKNLGYKPSLSLEKIDLSKSISEFQLALEKSSNLDELVENMLLYLKNEFELAGIRDSRRVVQIDERTLAIWRLRLPWLIDTPETLDSIGKSHSVTRERVRQIQNLSTRFGFPTNIDIEFMNQIQGILLESSSLHEFMEVLKDENLLGTSTYSLGRIRAIARELGYSDLAEDIEKSIYKWAAMR